MGFADQYLSRQGEKNKLIHTLPSENLKITAVIPAYNESGLIESLDSLFNTSAIKEDIEILVLVNYPETAGEDEKILNQNIFEQASEWAKRHSEKNKHFHIVLHQSKDNKNSGVGLSRKILMDESVKRFNSIGEPDGIICSLDADTKVSENYFEALISHFKHNQKSDACSVYFEHPLAGNEFPEDVYKGICYYELHMRYYLQGLRYSGHPNCYYTVGSSFAVKAEAYCLQGGMNKRKAGEDFYFLQKFFDIGRFSECFTTSVFPSPRPSDRVPFGTGPVIRDYLKSRSELLSFNPELFFILKKFISEIFRIKNLEKAENFSTDILDPVLQEFLRKNHFDDALKEIISNSSDVLSFQKRLFRWFNMFRILKFLNYAKTTFPDVKISHASSLLLKKMGVNTAETDPFELLEIYRKIIKKST